MCCAPVNPPLSIYIKTRAGYYFPLSLFYLVWFVLLDGIQFWPALFRAKHILFNLHFEFVVWAMSYLIRGVIYDLYCSSIPGGSQDVRLHFLSIFRYSQWFRLFSCWHSMINTEQLRLMGASASVW